MFSDVIKPLNHSTALGVILACGTWSSLAAAQTPAGQDAPPATASDVPADQADIVVTGQRAADRNAIAAKRTDSRIVDVISADDVGKMTDFNAGEALRRVAGVNVWSYLGEPRFVTIRGFNASYNTTTVDGFQMASPDNANYGSGRQFYMDALPSSVASKISVFKTFSPDMEGHFLGGSVDFAVPDALESKKDITSISVRGGFNANRSAYGGFRPTYQGEFTVTRKFGASDQFGFSLSGSYWRRETNAADTEIGGDAYSFGPATKSGGLAVVAEPYGGDYGPYPSGGTHYNYDDTRARKSLVSKLSWEDPGKAKFGLIGYYLEQTEHFLRNEWTLDTAQGGSNFDGKNFDAGYAEIDDVASQYQILNSSFTRRIWGVNGTFKYQFDDKLNATVAGGYSGASFDNPQLFNRFVLPAANNQYYSVTRNGDYWTWAPISPTLQTAFADLSKYLTSNGGGQSGAGGGRNLEEEFKTNARLFEFNGRLDYNMDKGDYGLGLATGIKHSSNYRRDGYDRTDYGNSSNGISLSDVASGDYLATGGCATSQCIVLIDPDKVRAAMSALPSTVNASAVGNRFSTSENIWAGWGMARWRAEHWQAVAGMRVEITDYATTGYQNVTGGSTPGYQPVSGTDHFTNLLPSFTFIYDTAHNMRTRFAYSRTIGRPSLTQKSLRGGTLDLSQDPPRLTQGNPDLKPLVSDNFDIIHELYFDRGQGMFTIGGFYKSIQNEIYKTQGAATIDDIVYYATRPVNSPYTTKVYGAEFNFIKNLTFLPGLLKNLGLQANGFIARTEFPIQLSDGSKYTFDVLPDQAKYGVNLALFYEDRKGISARVAWNRTGEQWDGRVSGSTNLPGADNPTAATLYKRLFLIPVDSVDFKLSYKFDKRFTVSVSGNNLLRQGASANIGNDQEIAARRIYVPTTYLFGFSARF